MNVLISFRSRSWQPLGFLSHQTSVGVQTRTSLLECCPSVRVKVNTAGREVLHVSSRRSTRDIISYEKRQASRMQNSSVAESTAGEQSCTVMNCSNYLQYAGICTCTCNQPTSRSTSELRPPLDSKGESRLEKS